MLNQLLLHNENNAENSILIWVKAKKRNNSKFVTFEARKDIREAMEPPYHKT